jgi:hypothetical protein
VPAVGSGHLGSAVGVGVGGTVGAAVGVAAGAVEDGVGAGSAGRQADSASTAITIKEKEVKRLIMQLLCRRRVFEQLYPRRITGSYRSDYNLAIPHYHLV